MHKTYGKEWRLWCERAGIGSITTETVKVKDLPAIVDEEAIIGKINAYMSSDKLEDLCGVVHIINRYYDKLSHSIRMMLCNALEYKGIAHFDYVVSTQIGKNVNLHQLAMIVSVDGLTGFGDAISAVYPKAEIQRCIVHQVRYTTKFVNYKDMKPFVKDLKAVY